MSPQSHVSHYRVLPLSEFTVMIPEPHATLQGAVTRRNLCHDRATLQGVIIFSAILKIVFCNILLIFGFFSCSLGFDERRFSYRLRYTCLLVLYPLCSPLRSSGDLVVPRTRRRLGNRAFSITGLSKICSRIICFCIRFSHQLNFE